MSKNLEKFNRSSNTDWSLWVKLVKQTYKDQGIMLSQNQSLMLAKDTYPGKGNVIGKPENQKNIPISDKIPDNPVRRKKEPAPKEKPKVYKREVDYDRHPPKNKKKHRKYESSSDESSEEETPPRRRRTRREDKYDDTPPRRKSNYREASPVKYRKREESRSPRRKHRK